jgi:hypothetical protein
MRRFYFDLRDENGLLVGEDGVMCRDLQAVQTEAARAIADMARDAVHMAAPPSPTTMSIEVRDDDGPVMQVDFRFEVVVRAGS